MKNFLFLPEIPNRVYLDVNDERRIWVVKVVPTSIKVFKEGIIVILVDDFDEEDSEKLLSMQNGDLVVLVPILPELWSFVDNRDTYESLECPEVREVERVPFSDFPMFLTRRVL